MPAKVGLRRRTDGYYVRSLVIGRKPDGKPVRKYIYAKTIRELESKVADYRQRLMQGMIPGDEKMTFGQIAEIWLRDYKPTIEVNTRKKYTTLLQKHLLPELSTIRLRELKPFHLQAVINRLAMEGYATATLKEIKTTAAQILDIAVDNDIVFRNVFSKVSIPRIEPSERRALTEKEIALVSSTYAGHRMGLAAMLMLYCGLRRGEMIALTWKDIDLDCARLQVNKAAYFDGNRSYIKSPKTKSGTRWIPVPEGLLEFLRGAARAPDCVVCPNAKGGMMTQIAFKRAWDSYLFYLNVQAGGRGRKRGKNDENGRHTFLPPVQMIENITPHMLRHTYASMLYEAGVDVKSAQRFMGHSSIEITLRVYTHLSEQKEKQAVDVLNEHFRQKLSP